MKPIVIITIAFILLVPISAFAQSSSQENNCPTGTKLVVNGMNIDCVPISIEDRTCPRGSYVGLDNEGNDTCRDIETNQVVEQIPIIKNNQKKESSNPTSLFEKNPVWIIFVTIVLVIIVIVISKRPKHKGMDNFTPNSLPSSNHSALSSDYSSSDYSSSDYSSSDYSSSDYSSSDYSSSDYSSSDTSDSKVTGFWSCSSCKQKFSNRESYISHGCHSR
jgi:hypothetical protein